MRKQVGVMDGRAVRADVAVHAVLCVAFEWILTPGCVHGYAISDESCGVPFFVSGNLVRPCQSIFCQYTCT